MPESPRRGLVLSGQRAPISLGHGADGVKFLGVLGEKSVLG